MNFEQNSALPKRFVTSVLPWLVGLGALVIYLATMNRWATPNSAGIVAWVEGWTWQPQLQQPLLFIVLAPFRLLPAHLIPLALNLFNAVLASLVIVLLARSVALLPHDRTSYQRRLEHDENALFSARSAWIPPVLAAIVLGLQISFWENATAITGEMIDAFIVAYVVRCLLEYRIDQRQSWMSRAAFLYAAGMTNNWALIGLAPFFLIAIIWIKGFSFFNAGFLGRMVFWSIAGLLLYLLLPLICKFASATPIDFWPALKVNLRSQKTMLSTIYSYLKDNYRVVVVIATSLLPLFVIGLRWRSTFGDNNYLGILIAKAIFHFVHALFFGICLLVVLGPRFSPRQLFPGFPFLTHGILAALVVGYCAGYFLIVCSPPAKSRSRMHPLVKLMTKFGFGFVAAMLVVMPAALIGRNLEVVQLTNKRLVNDFATRTERNLPEPPCAIVSDDPGRLSLIRVHLLQQHRAQGYLFYDTHSAEYSDYHAFQKRSQGEAWPAAFASLTNHVQISPRGLIMFLGELLQHGPVYYLQPSFGYYFEPFQMKPEGIVYSLSSYPTNQLLETPLSAQTIQQNQQFWQDFDSGMLPVFKRSLPAENPRHKPAWQARLLSFLHLPEERNLTAEYIARFYSRASTCWGVQLQKLGDWDAAGTSFERALALNKDNVAAEVNLQFNTAHRKNEPVPEQIGASIEDTFGRYNNWNQVIGDCGTFDDPRFTFEQARTFLAGQLYRQALQDLHRVTELQPTNLVASIWLADLYSMLGQPDESLQIVQRIRQNRDAYGVTTTNELNLDRIEATALFRTGDKEKAKAILISALAKPQADAQFRTVAAQILLQNGLNAEALPVLNRLAADNPADIMALANRGYAYLQLERYDDAKKSLTQALELAPDNSLIRLNRAITLLRAKDYDAAREDYELLLKQVPNAYQVQYGLGEIAAAKNDTIGAISHFEDYLKVAPPGTPEYLQVSNRLAEVKAGKE